MVVNSVVLVVDQTFEFFGVCNAVEDAIGGGAAPEDVVCRVLFRQERPA